MIYEIRMTVVFSLKGTDIDSAKGFGSVRVPITKKTKITLIDYLEADGVAEAFNKAAEYKHRIVIDIAKGESDLFTRKGWGELSSRISISLDAVVAKPELRFSSKKPLGVNETNIDWIVKEFGISYATQLLMKNQGYKIVKLVPELNTLDEDEEAYAGWEADTKQIMTIAKSLKKTTDRQKALKKLAKMKTLMMKLEKKYY